MNRLSSLSMKAWRGRNSKDLKGLVPFHLRAVDLARITLRKVNFAICQII